MSLENHKGTTTVTDEKSFIFRDSYNKGQLITPSMVVSCIGLSAGAKAVYIFISMYIYEAGNKAFPSIERISCACNVSPKSTINYIDELVEKGFILRVRQGNGQSNSYHFRGCHEVPLLHVSEMVWKAIARLQTKFKWKAILPARNNLVKQLAEYGVGLGDLEVSPETEKEIETSLVNIIKGGRISMGLLPKNKANLELPPQKKPHTIKNQLNGGKNIKVSDMKGIGVDSSHYKMVPVDEWKLKQIRDYFFDRYLDATGMPHPTNVKKHKGLLQRVIDHIGDSSSVKMYIDTFFDMGYDTLSLEYFSTSNRLAEIQTFLHSGKKPFYLNNSSSSDNKQQKKASYKRKSVKDLLGGDSID